MTASHALNTDEGAGGWEDGNRGGLTRTMTKASNALNTSEGV